jgi:hypothetical protein
MPRTKEQRKTYSIASWAAKSAARDAALGEHFLHLHTVAIAPDLRKALKRAQVVRRSRMSATVEKLEANKLTRLIYNARPDISEKLKAYEVARNIKRVAAKRAARVEALAAHDATLHTVLLPSGLRTKLKQRASVERYMAKGLYVDTSHAYRQTPKFKATQKAYNQTPKAKAAAKSRKERDHNRKAKGAAHAKTPGRKASLAAYKKTEKGRAVNIARNALGTALRKAKTKKRMPAEKYFGCTLPELYLHLEGLFVDGMTMANHGQWHIDHIRPVNSFDHTIAGWEFEANHYTNLQPLWAADNLAKGAKWVSGCSEGLEAQPN